MDGLNPPCGKSFIQESMRHSEFFALRTRSSMIEEFQDETVNVSGREVD